MKRFAALLALVLTIAACNKIVPQDNVSLVKNGVLELDKSIALGQAIDKYRYFSNVEWKELKTDNGKKIVVANAVVDIKHQDIPSVVHDNLAALEMQYFFTINQDSTYGLVGCGFNGKLLNSNEMVNSDNYQIPMKTCTSSLKSLYNNDKLYTWFVGYLPPKK